MFRFVDVYPWLACAGLGFDSDFYSIAYYRPRLINRPLTVVRDTHVIHIRVLYHFTRILRLLDLQLFESIAGMSESRFIVGRGHVLTCICRSRIFRYGSTHYMYTRTGSFSRIRR